MHLTVPLCALRNAAANSQNLIVILLDKTLQKNLAIDP
jgi:hypothetical protein